MKIVILKNNLKEGLDAISRVAGDASITLPILKNFLIETADGRVKLSATNLELAITSFISGKVVEGGDLTVPLNLFSSIINNLQSERINLEKEGESLVVKTDNYQAKIQSVKKEEFPIIPGINNGQLGLEIPILVLKEALLSIMSAAQISDMRPELGGVLFDFQINLLKVVATDSFRLAEKTIHNSQFQSDIDKHFKAIIPLKTISEVVRIFKDGGNKKVKIYFDPNQVLVKADDLGVISRLISGEFPDYQPIIPKSVETEVVINRNELINALKLTGSFTDRLNEVKIFIKEKAKNIEVFSSNQNLGENRYLIPAKIKGLPMEVVFNWRFLLDGIKGLNSENVVLEFSADNKPVLIKSPEDSSFFYILMPIKAG